jgi:hypothetical protein
MNVPQHIETLAFDKASTIIDESGVPQMVVNWLEEDNQQLAFTDLDIRSALTGWLATAFAGMPLTDENVAAMLNRAFLEFDVSASEVSTVTRQALHTMDYRPLPASESALTKSAYEAVLADRANSAEFLSTKRARHVAFTNAILRAQLGLAECVDGKMSVALGSVFRTAGVEGVGRNRYQHMQGSELVSAEPDAGFSPRTNDTENWEYGWEYEVATLVSDDLLRPESVPNIVVGIAGHRPHQHGSSVLELVHELLDNGRPLEHVTGDLGYFPGLRPEFALTPLREHGATVVMSYRPTDEGRALATSDDAILMEGRWYQKGLPTALVTAMKDFREASKRNRSEDGSRVLDADVQRRLEEQRDALLHARRAFEVHTPSTPANKYEQHYAYGSDEWKMAFVEGQYATTQFEKAFRDIDSELTPPVSPLPGEAAHGFITTLVVAATNAKHIAEWELYHSLDQGNGLMVDEWYALYRLLVPRIQKGMAAWSRERQSQAGSYWNVDDDEDTYEWRPDGAATVIEMERATDELADTIAGPLIASLRAQAEDFLNHEDGSKDLAREARIELALDFVDTDRHGGEDGTWPPVPVHGALVAAKATLVWSEV